MLNSLGHRESLLVIQFQAVGNEILGILGNIIPCGIVKRISTSFDLIDHIAVVGECRLGNVTWLD